MEDQQPGSGVGEKMMFGLIEQAEQMRLSAQEAQRSLSNRIGELSELQKEMVQLQSWSVNAALELQKRADATIQKLEVERMQLHNTRENLERNAMQAIHDAVRKQSGDIERQTVQAFAEPLHAMKQAAGYVRQHMKEVSWLMVSLIFAGGLFVGIFLGYWPMRSSQNTMQEQLNRIEQAVTVQQPPAPAAPDPKASGQKPKPKMK